VNRIEKIAVASKLNISFFEKQRLFEHYETLDDLTQACQQLPVKINPNDIHELINRLEACSNRSDLKMITYEEEGYPELLTQISDPPWCLFVKGDDSILSDEALKLAVVGSRKSTRYGKLVIDMLIPQLVERGVVVVSGLAFGIDSLAHQKALESNAKVIGVLGCGVDTIYPKSNERLYRQVIQTGCLVSEYFPWETPRTYYFPMRNRIISGLSRGVLVVEAAKKSGSLITARCGLEQNRDVFAVPGQINAYSSGGTNDLIKKGAIPVTEAEDVFQEYPDYFKAKDNEQSEALKKRIVEDMSQEEKRVFSLIETGVSDFDTLSHQSELDASVLNYTLTLLTLKGVIDVVGTSYHKRT